MSSAAKSVALVDVVGCEFDARGVQLRALVLTDTELATVPGESLAGVLRPEAGSAPEAVRALATDVRTAPLRPLLVSGRGLRCAEQDADALLAALMEAAEPTEAGGEPPGGAVGVLRAEPTAGGLVRLTTDGGGWLPRVWVELATRIFTAGYPACSSAPGRCSTKGGMRRA